MRKKTLYYIEDGKQRVKEIAMFKEPESLQKALNEFTWKLLTLLSKKDMYPIEIAEHLGVHEQKVYYHIRKLVKAGVIQVVKEERRKGAIAKYYKASFPAFGIELPFGSREASLATPLALEQKLRNFFHPLVRENGKFDGRIVVGSPDPHGPFKTRAKDGHYASYLALFIGQFSMLPEDFFVKLDVDVAGEKEENNNFISVGGPGTNLLTQKLNRFLPTKFNMAPSKHGFLLGGLVSEKTGRVYTEDSVGVITKIPNPWSEEKKIIVLAGNKTVGTKACVLALSKFWRQTLHGYGNDESFSVVVQGFDCDGDGKIDSIEVVE